MNSRNPLRRVSRKRPTCSDDDRLERENMITRTLDILTCELVVEDEKGYIYKIEKQFPDCGNKNQFEKMVKEEINEDVLKIKILSKKQVKYKMSTYQFYLFADRVAEIEE